LLEPANRIPGRLGERTGHHASVGLVERDAHVASPLPIHIRVDDAVLETKEAWARLLRGQRNIGDFTRWKEHEAYHKGQGPRAAAARPQGRGKPSARRITRHYGMGGFLAYSVKDRRARW
jgi:hypothetical protein